MRVTRWYSLGLKPGRRIVFAPMLPEDGYLVTIRPVKEGIVSKPDMEQSQKIAVSSLDIERLPVELWI